MRRWPLLYVLSVLICGCASEPPHAVLVLMEATIIDGTGATSILRGTIVLDEERIVAIGPAAEVEIPEGAQVRRHRPLDAYPESVPTPTLFKAIGRPGSVGAR